MLTPPEKENNFEKLAAKKTRAGQSPLTGFTLAVYNTQGKEVETVKLDAGVFDGKLNTKCLYQAVTSYLANQRRGLAATKTRGEVSGGGRKPWKQKGTGRARVGSTRSPLWRHGGVVFGPHPRDFSYHLPAKIKSLALKVSLNAKLKENNFMLLDEFKLSSPKTKLAAALFSGLKLTGAKAAKKIKVLLLVDKLDKQSLMALKNLDFLTVNSARDTHAYEVMNNNKLLVTKAGLGDLTERLKK